MAGNIGDSSNTARKIKKIYYGNPNNNTANKVKKVYVGDQNNVARLVWKSMGKIMMGTDTSNSSGTIYVSEDGKNFVKKNTLTTALTGLNHANNKYIASVNDGRIYNSEDGETWTQSNYIGSIGEVEYGNGMYVVPVKYNGMYYSTDLINWTNVSSKYTYDVAIDENNHTLQNYYETSSGTVTCSTCGGSGSQSCTGSFSQTGTGNGTLICSCGNYSVNYTTTYYSCSVCGASYSARTISSGGRCSQCGDIFSAGTEVYGSTSHNSITCPSCSGSGNNSTTYYYYYSTLLNSPNGSQINSIMKSGTEFNKAYYYNGYFFSGYGNTIYKINSSDGSYTTSVPNSSGNSIIGIHSGNGKLLVVYYGSTGSCVSTDMGNSWTQGSIGGIYFTDCDITFTDDKFYLVGYTSNTQYLFTSVDGINWTQISTYTDGAHYICAPKE